MKVLKVMNPKGVSVSLTTVAVALIAGMALTANAPHHAAPQPVQLLKTASAVTSSAPTAPSALVDTTSTLSTSSVATGAPTSQQTATATSDSTQTTQTTTADPAPPTDPVVAVSAELSDWSDPQPTKSIGKSSQGTPLATVAQYRYCTWIYSDGSTQRAVVQEKDTTEQTADGMQITSLGGLADCSLASAPATN